MTPDPAVVDRLVAETTAASGVPFFVEDPIALGDLARKFSTLASPASPSHSTNVDASLSGGAGDGAVESTGPSSVEKTPSGKSAPSAALTPTGLRLRVPLAPSDCNCGLGERHDRFLSYIERLRDCWNWTGARQNAGYGHFRIGERKALAHRLAYEHFVGPIPDGMEIDHTCRSRWCVNPAHLDAVTHRENRRRGVAAAQARPHIEDAPGAAAPSEKQPTPTRSRRGRSERAAASARKAG